MNTTNTLQQAYNRTHWNTFLHSIFADKYEAVVNPFQESVNSNISKNAFRLGEIKLNSGEIIAVYDVELKDSVRIAQNKVAIRNLLKQSWKYYDGAFIASYKTNETDWRFSFLSETKEWATNGNYETVKTQAKRYTYLLGENQSCLTATDRFDWLAKKEKTLSNIKEAFSVETLTRQFYGELFDWYQWATAANSGVTFPNSVVTVEDDREQIDTKIIRLITRLMFVWFIKQSDLIPEKIFNVEPLKKILKDFDPLSTTSGNYYNAILQNLFFATLNRAVIDEEGNNRAFAKLLTKDVKTLYRYAELFNISENEVIKLFAEVPFLNGGLFECLDKTKTIDGVENAYNYDGFSRNDKTFADGRYRNRAFVPNILFFEPKKGLLSILKRYNFTIEENTPQEQQVALDPELLGKVFENLLGAYNPETKETARNQSGSFYTPREIVDYMADEALITYLGDTAIVRSLFQEECLPEVLRNNKEEKDRICSKLKEVKILDPACGSGAFPMGILNRIVDILQKLSDNNDENSIYNKKLQIIENCIFGVDIQNIATQISKLRFFISLICHCKKDSTKLNFGIPTLPNLETKFVSANSLIGIKQQDTSALDFDDESLKQMRDQLQDIRHSHFKAKSSSEKINLRKKDEKLRSEIEQYILLQTENPNYETIAELEKEIEKLQKELKPYLQPNMVDDTSQHQQTSLFEEDKPKSLFQKDTNEPKRKELTGRIKVIEEQIKKEKNKHKLPEFENAIRQLAAWNPYDQNSVSSFFDPEWMFGIKDGFDIVIGNPPYISTKGVSDSDKKMYETEFGFSDDTYNLFTFKGLYLTKENGSLTYIIPKTFWTTQTKRNMRELILKKSVNYVFDTANPFEAAMVDTCIIQVVNKSFTNNHHVKFLDGSKNLKEPIEFEPILQNIYRETQNLVIFKPTEYNLKIWNLYGKKVKELYNKWWDKIETSKKIAQNVNELEEYRKNLTPGDVALLGCLTEGGQGLATANNGKYVAIRRSTKWAKSILESRPKKLIEAVKKYKITEEELDLFSPQEFLKNKSELEIALKFDQLKEKYGRDIFGQGYIFRLIEDDEIADVDLLTDDEKENGIDISRKYYVPYDKGDKDGNRWYLETPFAIAWSKENVRFLKTDSKARYQGYTFYFREGFCWIDVNSTFLKARLKGKGVFDVLSMSLFTMIDLPDWYYVCLINSHFISIYVDNFINNTSHFQINDARQLPIIVPNKEQLCEFQKLFSEAESVKKQQSTSKISMETIEEQLYNIQERLDRMVCQLYAI